MEHVGSFLPSSIPLSIKTEKKCVYLLVYEQPGTSF